MKTSIFTLCFTLIALGALAQDDITWITYDKEGVTMKYPSSWAISEGVMGTQVVFQTPIKDEGDNFADNLNLVIQEIPGPADEEVPLEDVAELTKGQLRLVITDFKEIASGPTKVGNQEAYAIEFQGRQGEYELRWKQTFFIIASKAYILTYTAKVVDYDTYIGLADQIIQSTVVK